MRLRARYTSTIQHHVTRQQYAKSITHTQAGAHARDSVRRTLQVGVASLVGVTNHIAHFIRNRHRGLQICAQIMRRHWDSGGLKMFAEECVRPCVHECAARMLAGADKRHAHSFPHVFRPHRIQCEPPVRKARIRLATHAAAPATLTRAERTRRRRLMAESTMRRARPFPKPRCFTTLSIICPQRHVLNRRHSAANFFAAWIFDVITARTATAV